MPLGILKTVGHGGPHRTEQKNGSLAGWRHSLLLRSDGTATTLREQKGTSLRDSAQSHVRIPVLPANRVYTDLAAGQFHGVFLRDDGVVVSCGRNDAGQCDLPQVGQFTQVAAGYRHTVALRRDGTAVAVGDNR